MLHLPILSGRLKIGLLVFLVAMAAVACGETDALLTQTPAVTSPPGTSVPDTVIPATSILPSPASPTSIPPTSSPRPTLARRTGNSSSYGCSSTYRHSPTGADQYADADVHGFPGADAHRNPDAFADVYARTDTDQHPETHSD